MAATRTPTSSQYQALYQSTVQDAAAGGSLLMGKLVTAARSQLQERETACRDLRERDAIATSAKHLRAWESKLCERYPQALLDAFANPDAAKKAGTQSIADVQFDELELMDEVQVQTSVTLARTQQVAMLAAEASLAELNTLICRTMGLGAVNAERNPLRPQIYISALQAVVEQTQLPAATQLDWLAAMSTTLGQELRKLYTELSAALRKQGVVAAGYAVMATPTGPGIGRGVAQGLDPHTPKVGAAPPPVVPTPARTPGAVHSAPEYGPGHVRQPAGAHGAADDTLLTLDKLRRLLAGELIEPVVLSAKERFAQQFAREFEDGAGATDAPATDFDATVPAALEALKELKQVDAFVQRIQHRRSGAAAATTPPGDTSIEAIRAHLRSQADGLAQTLSLEVVSLMVDNIAHDDRLLVPVQQLIRRLEPALLRLALVDPRLFTNKQHPARMLVQEVADHSLAYDSTQASGFVEFVDGVAAAIAPLEQADIEDEEPFEQVLHRLQDAWKQAAQASAHNREQAMQALQQAEQRNLLAEKIARDIAAHSDAGRVPAVVMDFLCGPWAQVVAQARMGGTTVEGAADKYQALISALLWSTHPELTRKNIPKLTRLVPLLLGNLREGLDTIHYPATRTSTFLEALMGLHQQAFQVAKQPAAPQPPPPAPAAPPSTRPHLVDEGNPWLAPGEAQASNFIDLPDTPVDTPSAQATDDDAVVASADTAAPALSTLALGSWIELWIHGEWVRTQLTWASPHGTLFLFTSAQGATQSMTRRSGDKLVAAGHLRVISSRPVVDGALNAVAQMALRNSVNTGD
ncbi:MAG: DUF1631 family protein [Burkholderiales bacterium]|nr:DUF1631 family protein [Burkholderiales bacterium]